MHQMSTIGLMSEVMAVIGGIAFLVWCLTKKDNNHPPPSSGSDQLNSTDGYFLNEWCDGDS